MAQGPCNGRGGGGGDHCCYINGAVCQFLVIEGDLPRCSLFEQWGRLTGNPDWVAAPVGQFFVARYPGFDCGDWPQDIPVEIAGRCCYA